MESGHNNIEPAAPETQSALQHCTLVEELTNKLDQSLRELEIQARNKTLSSGDLQFMILICVLEIRRQMRQLLQDRQQ